MLSLADQRRLKRAHVWKNNTCTRCGVKRKWFDGSERWEYALPGENLYMKIARPCVAHHQLAPGSTEKHDPNCLGCKVDEHNAEIGMGSVAAKQFPRRRR